MKYVNLDYLHELSGNDTDFEKVMMEQFVQQTPEELQALENAIGSNDLLSAKKVAHSLKSTVSYMGLAPELHPPLESIEKAAVSGNAVNVQADFNHIKTVTSEAVKEIVILLKEAQ
ncbi:MAG TPA: Hpt domain-containing protein [Chitinophagaceae bacterium]|jgi:HPt (histidine-containing phosphotransfer) domain-containing protein|nr:Hpt domain-containing protein [Chitinophagaceae bacterium]